MVKKSCGVREAEREHYRLHYCGTCKSVGKQYSQSARMLLNSDCVFLAELLTALSKEDTAGWQDSYHSWNCLASGGAGTELPLPLRYAATTNVLLSALKTDDNLKDSPAPAWRFMLRWFNADFKKAENEMAQFGVDIGEIWHWIRRQQQREHAKNIPADAEMALKYFSEPTARITATIFSQGAAYVGRNPDVLYDFGYQLGELIYVLDALEDEKKDKKKNNFNALQRIHHTMDAATRQSAAACLRALTLQLQNTIQNLPIPDSLKEEYTQRLSVNVSVRLKNALAGKRSGIENIKRNLRSRLALRVLLAQSFAQRMAENKPAWIAAPQYAFSYFFVLMIPSLPQEFNTNTGQNVYAAPAFVMVTAAFLSALVFRRQIKRFASIYKKELKSEKVRWETGPHNKKMLRALLPVSTLAPALSIFLFSRTRAVQSIRDGCCENCINACCEACIYVICSIVCSAICNFLCSDICNHGEPIDCCAE